MQSRTMDCIPLREEGFIDAKFIHMNRSADLAKYHDEKEIITKAIAEYNKTSNA